MSWYVPCLPYARFPPLTRPVVPPGATGRSRERGRQPHGPHDAGGQAPTAPARRGQQAVTRKRCGAGATAAEQEKQKQWRRLAQTACKGPAGTGVACCDPPAIYTRRAAPQPEPTPTKPASYSRPLHPLIRRLESGRWDPGPTRFWCVCGWAGEWAGGLVGAIADWPLPGCRTDV